MSDGVTPCRQLGPSHGENMLLIVSASTSQIWGGGGGRAGRRRIEWEGGI